MSDQEQDENEFEEWWKQWKGFPEGTRRHHTIMRECWLASRRTLLSSQEKRIEKLEEGIRKHKATPNATICDLPPNIRILAKLDADQELYKLLER